MKTCHEEQQRKREADTVLNNKKLDLLKVRVSDAVPITVGRLLNSSATIIWHNSLWLVSAL
jgi:hypothetical protein